MFAIGYLYCHCTRGAAVMFYCFLSCGTVVFANRAQRPVTAPKTEKREKTEPNLKAETADGGGTAGAAPMQEKLEPTPEDTRVKEEPVVLTNSS